jgi:predicted DCC family thiol-disulfide oxidoreductase YuxK
MDGASPVIFFDGVCNLCNRVVQFVIKKDKKKVFRFASLQGKAGQEVLRRFNLSPDDLNSFIVLEGDRIYLRSAAALRVVKSLRGGWKLLYAGIILPRFIRDALYNWIARNRYKWYGKRNECMIPSPELKERFLD